MSEPEAGAQCVSSARWDLCGGRPVEGRPYRDPISYGRTVWHLFRSWLRTMHRDRPPSELVVAHALRTSLPEFLAAGSLDPVLAKFLRRQLLRPRDQARQRAAA